MDQSYQLSIFILTLTTLFTDIKPTEDFSYNWYDAQDHCFGRGLTLEKDKSEQPYWTGVYRRWTPWINILGCYSDDFESQPDVVEMTMIISSVGMCQEICHHENIELFAIKMNKCLCIKSRIHLTPFNRLSASDCNNECDEYSDSIYSVECGGESAYNLYETQGVNFTSVESCLSLQCSPKDKRFIPQKCSDSLQGLCENSTLSNSGYASSWSFSMEQCRESQPSTYLLGDINLNDPGSVCERVPSQFKVVWVGVAQQIYTSIDQVYFYCGGLICDWYESKDDVSVSKICEDKNVIGNITLKLYGWEVNEEQTEECQMCVMNKCQFIKCSELSANSIFCNKNTDEFQGITTSKEHVSASTSMSIHSTLQDVFVSTTSAIYFDTDQSPSTKYTERMSSASDQLALKVSLPVIMVIIIVPLCALAVVFYLRKRKMTKADKTTNTEVESGPRKNIDSNVDSVQNNSYFVLEQCPQYISKGSVSTNESPYNNSGEGVYDHLRDKISRKPEVEDTYQHASAGIKRDMSEYDTMANAFNKKQEEDASYDYSNQDTNGNYARHIHAKNNLTDDPYDVAV